MKNLPFVLVSLGISALQENLRRGFPCFLIMSESNSPIFCVSWISITGTWVFQYDSIIIAAAEKISFANLIQLSKVANLGDS
jgi:hypothetical protein